MAVAADPVVGAGKLRAVGCLARRAAAVAVAADPVVGAGKVRAVGCLASRTVAVAVGAGRGRAVG